jgi:hypothetical protein
VLVVAQVAPAVVLLVSAGLLVQRSTSCGSSSSVSAPIARRADAAAESKYADQTDRLAFHGAL